jgi:homoserine dehydrogenase
VTARVNGELRIGLLGLGQVGGGVLRLLAVNAREIEARLGMRIRPVRAAVRDPARLRVDEAQGLELVRDPREVVSAGDVDLVVEVMGGLEPARSLILEALANGKPVVTANKALLATHGEEIFAAATRAGVDVRFEAAVCGGVPIIRTLREALASDRIESLRGIVNGTTNYILSAMEQGRAYGEALARAQELGFAEADPTFDVSGRDAAQKLQLLASLAFGVRVGPGEVPVEGIEAIEPVDFTYAREFGCTVKLIASARREGGSIELGVRPTLVSDHTLLATTKGAFNAVELRSYALGMTLLVGQGAGALPTGSAVVSDIIEAGRDRAAGTNARVPHLAWHDGRSGLELAPPGRRTASWYLRFHVADEPGVLAQIAGALGAREISIAAVIQRERARAQEAVPVVVVTHEAREDRVREAVAWLDRLGFARGRTRLLPIERAVAEG